MPFQIIRNDITKVKADAIVNTANPHPMVGGGTDSAIYAAAGRDELLKERKKIGEIDPGNSVHTKAYALKAKYIIHTVGPAWEGGEEGEFDILRSCYHNSLHLAKDLKCESIAFPLIATGVYGFPKDKALSIATSVIQEFLFENDMDVILVVFDKRAFELSGKVYADVQSFVDEHDVDEQTIREYYLDSRTELTHRDRRSAAEIYNNARAGMTVPIKPAVTHGLTQDSRDYYELFMNDMQGKSLTEIIDNPAATFQERLLKLIDNSGMTDVEVYKRANVTKKVFSDIRTKKNYKPSKKTAVAFIIALQLPMNEALDLLSRAEIALSPSNKFDLIIGYFISRGSYDIFEINEVLFDNDQECLG